MTGLSGAHAFTRASRLAKPSQYRHVFDRCVRVTDGVFTVLARDGRPCVPRLGLAVSKRCARTAVQRNRIKRVVRESFRHRKDTLPAADFVVMCRPAATGLCNERLFASLDGLWDTAEKRLAAGLNGGKSRGS